MAETGGFIDGGGAAAFSGLSGNGVGEALMILLLM